MIFLLQLVHISKIIRNFAVEKVMMSENKRNLTEKEEYYKLITDEKSNPIETKANGAGSQCVRRKNIGSLSFRERYLSLRLLTLKPADFQRVLFFFSLEVPFFFYESLTRNLSSSAFFDCSRVFISALRCIQR